MMRSNEAMIERIWNWLPVFRVVAEKQSISEASRILFVSPPSLSRTIRLLEEEMQQPLFDRVRRRLVLNATGRALFEQVQVALGAVGAG